MVTAAAEPRTKKAPSRTQAAAAPAKGRPRIGPPRSEMRRAEAARKCFASLTPYAYLVLWHLGEAGVRPADAICEELRLTGAETKAALGILSRGGFVETSAGPKPNYRLNDKGITFEKLSGDVK